MARPLRVEFEGAVYHITSRGNGRQDIFLGDKDRACFLAVLGDVVGDSRVRPLFSNPVRLNLRSVDLNISRHDRA